MLQRNRSLLLLACLGAGLSGCSDAAKEQKLVYDPYVLEQQKFDVMDFTELDLGDYGLTFRPKDSVVSRSITFKIYAVVPMDDQMAIAEKLEQNSERLRDQVRETVLSNDLSNLSASSHALLKSDLVKTVRKALRTDQVKEVVFSDLSVE